MTDITLAYIRTKTSSRGGRPVAYELCVQGTVMAAFPAYRNWRKALFDARQAQDTFNNQSNQARRLQIATISRESAA